MQPNNIGYRMAIVVHRASLCIFLEERSPLKWARARVMPVQLPWGIFYRHMETRGGRGRDRSSPRGYRQEGRKPGTRRQSPRSSSEKIGSRYRRQQFFPFLPLSFSLPKTIAATSGTMAGFIPTFLPRYFI